MRRALRLTVSCRSVRLARTLLALAGTGAVLAGASCRSAEPQPRTGAAVVAPSLRPAAPIVPLEVVSGAHLALSDFHGKPVVLNFWASWCGPCREEIPSLTAAYRKLSPKGLVVLAVSIDEDRRALDAYLRSDAPPFPVLVDPFKAVAGRYGVSGIPCSFLLDSEGRVAERVDGSVNWMDPMVLDALEGLLAETPTASSARSDAAASR